MSERRVIIMVWCSRQENRQIDKKSSAFYLCHYFQGNRFWVGFSQCEMLASEKRQCWGMKRYCTTVITRSSQLETVPYSTAGVSELMPSFVRMQYVDKILLFNNIKKPSCREKPMDQTRHGNKYYQVPWYYRSSTSSWYLSTRYSTTRYQVPGYLVVDNNYSTYWLVLDGYIREEHPTYGRISL